MEPTAYVAIGTIIGSAINLIIGGIIKLRNQKHTQTRDITQDSYNGLLLLIDQLKTDINDRKFEYKDLDEKYDEIKNGLNQCRSEHDKEKHRREYLETVLIENGIKIKGMKPKGMFEEDKQ